jgi:hypothetical protein
MSEGQRGAPPSEENLSSERFSPIKNAPVLTMVLIQKFYAYYWAKAF